METQSNRRQGLPSWVAPILGADITMAFYICQTFVDRREEYNPLFQFFIGGVGVLGGLIVWCCDVLRRRNKNHQNVPHKPLKHITVQFSGRAIPGIRPHYEASKSKQAISQTGGVAGMLHPVGCGLISLCMFALLLGRLITAILIPEFSEGELTWGKLAVLIPIWSTGLVGFGLLIAGTLLDRANLKKTESSAVPQ